VNNEEIANTNEDSSQHENIINNEISFNVREITVENIPTSLTNEKLYELFFIFGDISKIQILKQEVSNHINYIFN